jgi:hypothetical protein
VFIVASPGSEPISRNDVIGPGRPRDEEQRTRLRTQTAEVLVARQSCEITLRDLAHELKTGSRMLVHHFGSRDALIGAGPASVACETDCADFPGIKAAIRHLAARVL